MPQGPWAVSGVSHDNNALQEVKNPPWLWIDCAGPTAETSANVPSYNKRFDAIRPPLADGVGTRRFITCVSDVSIINESPPLCMDSRVYILLSILKPALDFLRTNEQHQYLLTHPRIRTITFRRNNRDSKEHSYTSASRPRTVLWLIPLL